MTVGLVLSSLAGAGAGRSNSLRASTCCPSQLPRPAVQLRSLHAPELDAFSDVACPGALVALNRLPSQINGDAEESNGS